MEVSTEKSKIMTNSMNNINAYIEMNEQSEVREGDQFRVPGSNLVQGFCCCRSVRTISCQAALRLVVPVTLSYVHSLCIHTATS